MRCYTRPWARHEGVVLAVIDSDDGPLYRTRGANARPVLCEEYELTREWLEIYCRWYARQGEHGEALELRKAWLDAHSDEPSPTADRVSP
jgi:hypothetical protein